MSMDNIHIKNCIAYTEDGIRHDIYIENGRFADKKEIEYKEIDGSSLIAIPGFIDTHIHGIGGFGTEDGNPESIIGMSNILIKEGVTTFFPTIYTDTIDRITHDEEAIVHAMGNEKGAEIGGIHVEGPFISPAKIGAQNPDGRKDPSKEVMDRILIAGNGKIKAMTMAPELDGIEIVSQLAIENGIVPLCGHTNATYEQTMRGATFGIRHATHLFNAMTELKNRAPGVVGAVLSSKTMTAEMIGDGKHIHPANIRMVIDKLGADRVAIITDSLKPTRQRIGKLTANGVEVEMGDNLWVTKGNRDLIQGSCLTMLTAFRNLINWGFSIEDSIKMTSTTAARIYSLSDRGSISIGKRADLVLLNTNLDVESVFINGENRYVVR